MSRTWRGTEEEQDLLWMFRYYKDIQSCAGIFEMCYESLSQPSQLCTGWLLPEAAPQSTGSPSPTSLSLLGRKGNLQHAGMLLLKARQPRPCYRGRTCCGPSSTWYLTPRRTQRSQLCWKWNYPPLMSWRISGINWCYWWLLAILFCDPLRDKGEAGLCLWC